jgi:hypothetical protein
MTLSLDDLPYVDAAVPGMWMVQLREPVSGGVGNAIYDQGKSTTPIDGSWLRRMVVCMGVVGAVRVDGPECLLGDCSTLIAAPAATSEPEDAHGHDGDLAIKHEEHAAKQSEHRAEQDARKAKKK